MKVVILCGGKGTRMGESSQETPKPLVNIGDKPVLWHIMKYFSTFGFNDFILCLGYKGEKIEEYFKDNKEFNIQFFYTGEDSTKAQRLNLVKNAIDSENFFVAYGDDLSNVDIIKILKLHEESGDVVTLTAVQLVSQFGILSLNEKDKVIEFKEKPKLDHWINGGFFVFNKKIFDYFKDDKWELENEIFENIAKEKKIKAYKHYGFWQGMNTLKDCIELNKRWEENKADWRIWE
ncbi:NTP transferase domain-containing protein [Candidatus Woesearchaeota archaeon]|nr:NTP transferase domain-containing protein [Candidatus Woesearchaeota archaeon]